MGCSNSKGNTVVTQKKRVTSADAPVVDAPPVKQVQTLAFSNSGIFEFEEDLAKGLSEAAKRKEEEEAAAKRKEEEERLAQERQEAEWKQFEEEQAAEQAQLVADLQSGKIKENVFTIQDQDDGPAEGDTAVKDDGDMKAEDIDELTA